MSEHYDLVVVGGGINGVGIAADAAGRGLKVALFEEQDLASATSSNSSKLIHGGLRYLEHYEFRLVKEALAEREVLLGMAPHIARPMRFRLPHRPHLRPAWMIRAGLFLYDNLAKRDKLKGSCGVRFLPQDGLTAGINKGFEYSDAWVDDARLVVLNAMMARDKGAEVQTRTRCIKAVRGSKHWTLTLEREGGEQFTVTCRGLVNAAGPWVKTFYDESLHEKSPRGIRLIKGSHIIVPRIHEREEAYILQNEDNRIVFVIPYQQDYSLIGTTDVEHKGSPREAKISDAEINYLCKVVNAHFTRQIAPKDVIWTYAGVRPLCDDESDSPQAVTRDYTLELSGESDGAPLLSVFGGKLTTYRKLAQAACNKIKPWFSQMGDDWTATSRLPGGEFDCSTTELARAYMLEFDWLDERNARRIAEAYGSHARLWLHEERGQHFGAGLYESEVRYLMSREWAHSMEDILWRRSKLGLRLSQPEQLQLHAWLEQHQHALPKAS
ncbi:glycerol-3-phosphate dehydrogenase [Aeromonas salmonicida subsp. smithia]|uniref:glycerol-3-phosphate dehydrogenase n=1 Tax=Aeromonas salmonicida TaxID=645 RepID=UPI000731820A|nr:glycerol-3-phosphate dehydrogenase [Aeromonas salmonicida]KTA93858.1 glycerol-3-phosphate dehydrogenase [Aeromonas salmonicida subsp. smithia]